MIKRGCGGALDRTYTKRKKKSRLPASVLKRKVVPNYSSEDPNYSSASHASVPLASVSSVSPSAKQRKRHHIYKRESDNRLYHEIQLPLIERPGHAGQWGRLMRGRGLGGYRGKGGWSFGSLISDAVNEATSWAHDNITSDIPKNTGDVVAKAVTGYVMDKAEDMRNNAAGQAIYDAGKSVVNPVTGFVHDNIDDRVQADSYDKISGHMTDYGLDKAKKSMGRGGWSDNDMKMWREYAHSIDDRVPVGSMGRGGCGGYKGRGGWSFGSFITDTVNTITNAIHDNITSDVPKDMGKVVADAVTGYVMDKAEDMRNNAAGQAIYDAGKSVVNPVTGWVHDNVDDRVPADSYDKISGHMTDYGLDKAKKSMGRGRGYGRGRGGHMR